MFGRVGTRRSNVKAFLALVGFLGLVLAGQPQAQADEPIKLGAPIPVTGPYSSDGGVMQKAIKLAVEDLNAKGGLLGRQIEMIEFDIGDLTPDKLQASAINLIDKQGVNVLINGYGGMGPDYPAFCPYDVPYIHNDGTSNVIEMARQMECNNVFMGADADVNYGKIVFNQILQIGYDFPSHTVALLQGPYDYEIGVIKGAKEAAEAAGWKVVLEESTEYGVSDWGALLTKLRDVKPGLIFWENLDPTTGATFVDQFNTNPVKGALLNLGYTVSVPGFREVAERGVADGVLGMTLSAHLPNEAGEEFNEKWRKAYNEDAPYSIAAQVYDEVMIWAAAVTQVGSADDYAAIEKALRTMTYDGLTGRIRFNDEQYVYSSDDTVPTQLLQVQDKKVVPIMIGTKKNADFVKPGWLN